MTVGDAFELTWFKSSYSSSSNGEDCVEIAATPATIHVRDSKNAEGPQVTLSLAAWSSFVAPLSTAQ
ncbi:fibronectin type 3 domain-containing protein [Streptomyces phaeochromogenes]|uniref:DUF397 domain-containing protein n=1 Tax=Streptomyces phaeochromogenes TaxID=1923 RepID=UPI002790178F|nr:DUF397 domain-containing protein [Streptomyces phaeochromogenes]MDQ0951933.1 fibronectin type 3 domain-containing protein [Streptomyces phaeochromogenes]